jgi:hypothetical protein
MRSCVQGVRIALVCLLTLTLAWPGRVQAYSVLSHQAIIDAVWETHLKILLHQRFPEASEEELSGAQAYAYGGAIIQDMGYYPYGSPFFSDLTHYVRSGDFILALLGDAKNLNELAFALGALAHYAADNEGHRIGTNRAVPLLYPRLKKKYGDQVSYEDDRLAHIKTEFGFDVLEVAKERYAPEGYHDFIGFEVSRELLDQAFCETYGLELKDVLLDESRALNSYRHAVSKLIPKATKIAWSLKRDEIKDDIPDMTKRRFLFNLKRSSYERKWGKDYKKPTAGEEFLAFLYRLVPKFGPLKVLQFKTPTPEAEHLFEASFNATLDRYRALLKEAAEGSPKLQNGNFDVGEQTGPGKYRLNDEARAELLHRLAAGNFAGAPAELEAELETFFSDNTVAFAAKRDARKWAQLQKDLQQLRNAARTQALASTVR